MTQQQQPRLPWGTISPKSYQAMVGVSARIAHSSLGCALIELVQTRVSQINTWNRMAIGMQMPVVEKPVD